MPVQVQRLSSFTVHARATESKEKLSGIDVDGFGNEAESVPLISSHDCQGDCILLYRRHPGV
jgi:hypothetical protein